MKKPDKDILKTLWDYFLSVRGMALSADEGPEYQRHENAVDQTSCTVFALFGHATAERMVLRNETGYALRRDARGRPVATPTA